MTVIIGLSWLGQRSLHLRHSSPTAQGVPGCPALPSASFPRLKHLLYPFSSPCPVPTAGKDGKDGKDGKGVRPNIPGKSSRD